MRVVDQAGSGLRANGSLASQVPTAMDRPATTAATYFFGITGDSMERREFTQRLALVAAAGAPLVWTPARAVGFTDGDAALGVREALERGAVAAVALLGKENGFLGNPKVRIPLPGKLAKAQKTLKALGFGPQTEALVTAMNRAAEAAVPEARALFSDSIRKMTVQDAVGILTGPNDAATQYFRRTMSEPLTQRFLPIVARETKKVELAQRYDKVAGKAAGMGLIGKEEASLDAYVTQKALDGLFLKMAREEAAIRANPLGQASSIIKKVFGASK